MILVLTPRELAMLEKTRLKLEDIELYIHCCAHLTFHFQADVPTAIGVGPASEVPMETDGGGTVTTQMEKKYYIDSTHITVPRENVEINTPLRDGLGQRQLLQLPTPPSHTHTHTHTHTHSHTHTIPPSHHAVEDWDLYQRLIDHLYNRHLKTTPTEHPVLMSEPSVHTHPTLNHRSLLSHWITCVIVCEVGLQWNLSNPDTLGTEESVLISEVS